ncbi:inactive purple acid phosphatase 2 [Micractinium conductrix]|uniref:Purple acid phosphatase n=1 Tax=Micractinium conductrix TaxID=554055 RepID=A0A2P6VH12_9CHLO|nr:inactive purple acid phosphatase 2 [Micractinium conductrix]|eukprot:PSC73373.1 inactive purple acid phosphatase 2 [Micractinium conductrix]
MAGRLNALAWAFALFWATVAARQLHEGHDVEAGLCTPQQLHISLTGNPTEMRVQWKTAGGSCPSTVTCGPAIALLQHPMDPSLLRAHHGRQRSYNADDMCAAPARRYGYAAAHLHSAVLTGLEPQGQYFYQIEGGRPVEFTAPVPAGPHHSFSFLVFGDMGEGHHRAAKSPGAPRTVELLQKEHQAGAELVLHIGDISYANGVEEIWDTFMESIEPFARHIPYMVGAGNHEYDYERSGVELGAAAPDASGEREPYQPSWGNYGNDSGGECGVQISRRFIMPDVSDLGYWSRNLNASAADSLAAAAAAAAAGGGGANAAARRNPTLGPNAAAFLRRVAAAEEQQQQEAEVQQPVDRQLQAAAVGEQPVASNPPFWFSYSHGSVHFVVISTEHDLRPGSKQHRWLELDLSRVDRCTTPWVIVGMHRPMYVVYPHKSNRIVGDHLRDQLEDLFNEYQVDLVLSGHVHSYSRTCNVLKERCVPADEGGMTHIIVGCAGHKLTDISYAQEVWLEYAAVRFGYGRITVNSGFSLLFELVGDDGVAHDSVKLHNSRANLRGCNYGQAGAAAAAGAGAAGAAGEGACPGPLCPPWQQAGGAKGQQQAVLRSGGAADGMAAV